MDTMRVFLRTDRVSDPLDSLCFTITLVATNQRWYSAGSGKTFTMEGDKSNGQYGISQRTIQRIFSLLQDKAQQHHRHIEKNDEASVLSPPFEYRIEVSMLEIYNDEGTFKCMPDLCICEINH